MWRSVRRELAALEWAPEPVPGCNLLSEWTATVASLLNLRRSLAPLTDPDDPFALLVIATRGANRAAGSNPTAIASASLGQLRKALDATGPAAAKMPQPEGVRQIEVLTPVAYQLAHWARLHAGEHPARGWLSAAETGLDAALHRPAPRTSFGAALAGWTQALADVQRNPQPAMRRSVALGHLAILEGAHAVLQDAIGRGTVWPGYGQELTASIRSLGRAHRATITAIDRIPIDTSARARTVMLQLARSTRQLTDRTQRPADPAAQIDALLRTGIAHADVVADLTRHPQARVAAHRLQRLGLEYLANAAVLRRDVVDIAPPSMPVPPRNTAGVTASIDPGTILDAATVNALCEARNRGRLAAQADPVDPPAELRGSDPATWPRLVEEGRQAVADLVTSAMPLVRVKAFRGADSPDAQGALFLALTKAANAYEPTRTEGANWHAYAWRALDYEQWRGLDQAGVPRPRRAMPGPPVTLLGDREVSTFTPSPEEIVLGGRIGVEVVTDALGSLPAPLREPLHRLIAGQPVAEIAADLGMSPSTVRRRIDAARDILRPQLNNVDAAPAGTEYRGERWETSTPRSSDEETHHSRSTVTPGIGR